MKKVLLALLLILNLSCAQTQKENLTRTPTYLKGSRYAALEFEPGKTRLSEVSKSHLNQLAQLAAWDGKEIEEIKVLAWADKEYPTKSEKASASDIILAKERAQAVKDYLENDLHSLEDIDSYNMAKRPHAVSQLFHNDEWSVKEAFEKSGMTATQLPDGKTSYTKASKALVIIEYSPETKKQED